MIQLTYFLKVILCSSIFFCYYWIALRNKKFHQYNRFYLLVATIASWLIPLIKFQINTSKTVEQPIYKMVDVIAESNTAFEFEPVQQIATPFYWMQLIPIFYWTVAFVFLTTIVLSLFKIYRIYKNNPKQKVDDITLINTTENGTPFSFFKYIFWNNEIDTTSNAGKQILQHELTHVHEKHSWDKILMQINLVFGWFNPGFWLIKKELEMIHEFIADNKAIANSNAAEFASMLLLATFPTQQYKLTNPFFFSPIKRRLIMLTQKKNPKMSYLRRLVVLPLMAIVVLLFAFRKKEINDIKPLTKKYKVVIDAGHGGTDFGCTAADGTHEKDIDLATAKAIKQLNTNENIEIVLTRDYDRFDHVKVKADFSNTQKADLFVSIHCSDANNNKTRGTEIFVVNAEKDNGFRSQSNELAQAVNNSLKNDFINNGIKTRKVGIWVLQATQCPAILVETGFLSNNEDTKILKNTDKQNLIATDILKGIESYLNQKEKAIQIPTQTFANTNIDSATREEMNEYNAIVDKYRTGKTKLPVRFDFDKMSDYEQNRLFEIFMKMNRIQQNVLEVYFIKPFAASPKSIPTNTQINNWAKYKDYGIWIDGKQVTNSELLKYKATDFSQYDISKLAKNAINYGKHYYQLDLMTNAYYNNYVNENKKKKFIMLWGNGLSKMSLEKYQFKKNEPTINQKENIIELPKQPIVATNTNGATIEELKEYTQLIEKVRTGDNEIAKKFDTKKLTVEEREKMFEIFFKMDEQQKGNVEIKAHRKSESYTLKSPTQSQLNSWLINKQYTISIDHKPVSKESIQEIKATDFALYQIFETFINSSNSNENKYDVRLITNEFYSTRKNNDKRLYWENFLPKVSNNSNVQQAPEEEVKWMESFSKKYNPFAPSTATTTNGITEDEHLKAEQIFDKMSAEQKEQCNVVFSDPRAATDLNKEKGRSKYVSMKVNVRKRYY